MSYLIPHLNSLTEISRGNTSQQRLSTALYAAEQAQDAAEAAMFLEALGLAERDERGRLHASADVDGGEWFEPKDCTRRAG